MKKWIVLSIVPIVLVVLGVSAYYKWSIENNNQTSPSTNNQNALSSTRQTLPTVGEVVVNHPEATIFADAIRTFGYEENLVTDDEYTVFLPYDTAYENIPLETANAFVTYEQDLLFRSVIEYHIVEGRYETKDFKDGMTLKTVNGEDITLENRDGNWLINGYSFIRLADVNTQNGVIHTIDNFIFPPSLVYSQSTDN